MFLIYLNFLDSIIIAMVKNTQKKTTAKKEKVPQKAISKAEIREVARSKLCKGEGKTKMKGVNYYQIKELLN